MSNTGYFVWLRAGREPWRGKHPRRFEVFSHDSRTDFQVNLLLNSSGAKIKHLKNIQLEAAPGGESARGIWSALHDQTKPQGGYII